MSNVIPKRVLEDIRFRNDIADVIGSSFNLLRVGSSFKALCPFHKEKTPSFHVNPQRQIFHCFGCGAGGDVFRFIMQYEGVDFVTAARMLAQRAGIALETEPGGEEGASDKTVLYKLHEDVAAIYHRALLESPGATVAREYLKQRALGSDMVETFQIGYSPDRWDGILKWATAKKKYSREMLEKAGLIVRSAKPNASSEFYDRFRNRLMFPIRDEQGRVVAFSGRKFDSDGKEAKYVNSPETPLFLKSRVLYALDKARRQIVESREAIVCEGQIDTIRCHQAGFTTAVASQGTAFTEDHIRMLRRYADSAVIVFDSDDAGQDAAIRTAALFLGAGLAVRVAALPAGEDPDSFIRKNGAEAFRALLDAARSAVAFQVGVLSAQQSVKSEIGAMRASKAALRTIAQSPNSVQRAKMIQEAAELLALPPSALEDDLRHLMRSTRTPESVTSAKPMPVPAAARPEEEVWLCRQLVRIVESVELVELVRKYLPPEMIFDPVCRACVDAWIESGGGGADFQDRLIERDSASGELQRFAAEIMMAPDRTGGRESSREEALRDMILNLWRRRYRIERAEAEKRLVSTGTRDDPDARMEVAQKTSDIKMLAKWNTGAPIIEIRMAE